MQPKDDLILKFAEPARWFLCFARTSPKWWVRWLACGRYKHVNAFGCVNLDGVLVWVFYDVNVMRTCVLLTRDCDAMPMMEHWAADSDVISIRPSPRGSYSYRLGFWCVPAVKHLIGLRSGALRVDALWRDCLRNGAEIIDGGSTGLSATTA